MTTIAALIEERGHCTYRESGLFTVHARGTFFGITIISGVPCAVFAEAPDGAPGMPHDFFVDRNFVFDFKTRAEFGGPVGGRLVHAACTMQHADISETLVRVYKIENQEQAP